MPLVFEKNFSVYQFECDPWDRMLPGAILRRVQEIGTVQSEMLGLDEKMYQETHTLFMLSRISLEITRAPKLNEEIRMETRAYGMKRALYHRVTSLYSQDGTKLAEADSRWVLVDTKSRKILRKPPEGFLNIFNEEPLEEHSMEVPRVDQPLSSFGNLRAACTLCDKNKHINNASYADLMVDHLPIPKLETNQLKKMILLYRLEIPMNHIFEFSGAQLAENNYYFLAEREDKKSFEGFVWF